MKNLFLALFLGFFMAGCSISADTPNKVIIKDDEMKIEKDKGNKGKFCPPGQAKKGNC